MKKNRGIFQQMKSIDDLTIRELKEIIDKKDTAKILELLIERKDKWNELMRARDEINKEIKNQKKEGRIKETYIRLENMDLREKDFSGVNLKQVSFAGSNLSKSDFSGSDIEHSDFSGANLYEGNLSYSRISQSDFSDSNLYKANLRQTLMTGSVNLYSARAFGWDQANFYTGTRGDEWSYGDVHMAHHHKRKPDEPH